MVLFNSCLNRKLKSYSIDQKIDCKAAKKREPSVSWLSISIKSSIFIAWHAPWSKVEKIVNSSWTMTGWSPNSGGRSQRKNGKQRQKGKFFRHDESFTNFPADYCRQETDYYPTVIITVVLKSIQWGQQKRLNISVISLPQVRPCLAKDPLLLASTASAGFRATFGRRSWVRKQHSPRESFKGSLLVVHT